MTATINASTSSGLIQTADTSGTLALQSNGTTQFTVDSTGAYGQVERATAVASTSGTSINFTGLPSWVKRITVIFNGVSLNSTADLLLQIGTGGTPTTSGYLSYLGRSGGSAANSSATNGYVLTAIGTASNLVYGSVVLTNISGNIWVSSGSLSSFTTVAWGYTSGGTGTVASTLDMVRITSTSGTDTFDAGSINILYEG